MDSEQESFTSETSCSRQLLNEWTEVQDSLKERLITEDEFYWKVPAVKSQDLGDVEVNRDSCCGEALNYVGGVDLSFCKHDPSIACATLVVLEFSTLAVVHEDSAIVRMDIPYIAGFLAFREAPVLLELLGKMKKAACSLYPQVLMVDGNGLLHPRGFGLACHLGVLANIPTIGIGKNLHHVDGLRISRVRQLLEANRGASGKIFPLIGDSGSTLGAAMQSTEGSLKPIFISVGHRICLASAIRIVELCCRFRIPEPVRQADIRSKDCLRKHSLGSPSLPAHMEGRPEVK